MRIDFDRLILLLLPVRLRTVRLFSLIRVMLSPVVSIYNDVMTYTTSRRRRASATPQAQSIQEIVCAETGVSVVITPNTGSSLSPDFYVEYNNDATAAQVTAARYVIDRYKLAGKSYQVRGSVVPYSVTWSDMQCAILAITATDSHTWSDAQCEVYAADLATNVITLTVDNNTRCLIASVYPVTSKITVNLTITYLLSAPESVTLIIPAGSSYSSYVDINPSADTIALISQASISPSSDANYNYMLDLNINT